MRWALVAVVLLGIILSGCLEEKPIIQDSIIKSENDEIPPVNATEIVNTRVDTVIGTDFVGRDYVGSLCSEEGFPEPIGGGDNTKFEFTRIQGHKITENHTRLEFQYKVDDLFADNGISGQRFGAYYNHTLVFWSESFKEDANFSFELNGMYDIDKDARWTFFTKHTDPTTEDNEDACTSGFSSGSFTITVTAV